MYKYLFIFLLLFCCQYTYSQSKEDLIRKKSETKRQIEEAHKLLDETNEQKQKTGKKLIILSSSIELRTQYISQINQEINDLDNSISTNENNLKYYNLELLRLEAEYNSLLQNAYFNRSKERRLLYLFSSKSLSQAYRRSIYYRQLNDKILSKWNEILKVKDSIQNNMDALKSNKEKKQVSKYTLVQETKKIAIEKSNQEKLYSELKKKEKEIKKEIKEKEIIERKLEAEIRKHIEEEIRRKKLSSKKAIKEDFALSSDFKKNRGKLPWPLDNYVITQHFGEQKHPLLKGVMINNKGIDITSNSLNVKSVFNGEVSKIVSILGANYTVIIRHGNFLSVYLNIETVHVSVGDKVKTGQIIGRLSSKENAPILHFEIWEEMSNQNPEIWLR
jgi:septal ring factor EnvC (AmiA/AmiB activator)